MFVSYRLSLKKLKSLKIGKSTDENLVDGGGDDGCDNGIGIM